MKSKIQLKRTGLYWVKVSALCFLVSITSLSAIAGFSAHPTSLRLTDHVIKGVVKNAEDGAPVEGVNITLRGTSIGTATDAAGHFEFPQKLKSGYVLVFSHVGMETQEYVVPEAVSDIIEVGLTMNFITILGDIGSGELYVGEQKSFFKRCWSKVKSVF